ncbi:MAG: tRNA (guanosine(37)-N1)-methyltransferase TrmD [bacterium]
MKIDILSLFPDYFKSPFSQSLIAKGIEKKIIDIKTWDIRDFAKDKHKVVDDVPYGGGCGMVMKIEPVYDCIKAVEEKRGVGYKVLFTPRGKKFTQSIAQEWSRKEHLILICGRYEGVDERIYNFIEADLSIGDYILMGGEAAALVVVEAVTRLIKGVVGKEDSVREETFSNGLLEYPQYTRPYDFLGYKVPEVLLSGDHKKIEEWRRSQAIMVTKERRPDLIKGKGDA